ncbi:MAG: porin, partial [Acidobacteriota bacterium]
WAAAPLPAQTARAHESPFADAIVGPDLAEDERENTLQPRPEIFIQSRFARLPGPDTSFDQADLNFRLTRIETRWSGRLSEHLGTGLELQFHPLLDGHPEEIVNDAFLEWYPTGSLTVRAGQFIKPFGFDIQQSSFDREYPERGMWAGYFFPGQRDRGVMLIWRPETTSGPLAHAEVYAAVLNGNRFFNDNDGKLDTVLRVRRFLPAQHAAIGASVQLGSQIVPEAFAGETRVRLVGLDGQWAVSRLGLRAEWVHGTRPSTLLALEPVYTDAFAPGTTTDGLTTAALVNVTDHDEVFARWDRLTGDPMTARTVRVTDIGYRRLFDDRTRLAVAYQWKNAPTSNDDAVNTRFQVSLSVEF